MWIIALEPFTRRRRWIIVVRVGHFIKGIYRCSLRQWRIAKSAGPCCPELHIISKKLDVLAILWLMFPRVAPNPLVSVLKPTPRQEFLFGCSITSMVGLVEREPCFSAILRKCYEWNKKCERSSYQNAIGILRENNKLLRLRSFFLKAKHWEALRLCSDIDWLTGYNLLAG